jgi:hypothetical protein
MKTIIAGSRSILDYCTVKRAIISSGYQISEVVCGMAKGVDTLGLRYANEHNIPVKEFPAEWDKYGRSAGFRRNVQMAEYAEALLAICDHTNYNANIVSGTQHMINIATNKGLVVYVYSTQR